MRRRPTPQGLSSSACWRPPRNWSVRARRCWTRRSNTPSSAASSAGSSGPTRRSSTSSPTCYIAVELARPLVYGAALSLADGSADTARDVSAALGRRRRCRAAVGALVAADPRRHRVHRRSTTCPCCCCGCRRCARRGVTRPGTAAGYWRPCMTERRTRAAARNRRGAGRQARVSGRGARRRSSRSAATTSRCGSCCASRSARPRWWCPRSSGGAGGELADAAVVLEELGKALVPTPLLGTTLAELALLAADEPDTDALEKLAEGTAIGTVVFDPDYVVNGDVADVVVAADGDTARPLDRRSPRNPVVTMDPTRPLARLEPQDTADDRRRPRPRRHRGDPAGRRADRRRGEVPRPDRRLHQGPGAVRPTDRQLPGAQAPDGRPLRRGAVGARGRRRRRSPSRRPTSAALARFAASEAFSKVAAEAVQMHGGIAITWEHDIQLYFKRAHGSAQLLGPPREHLRRLESEVL